jgi:hypothetical protein
MQSVFKAVEVALGDMEDSLRGIKNNTGRKDAEWTRVSRNQRGMHAALCDVEPPNDLDFKKKNQAEKIQLFLEMDALDRGLIRMSCQDAVLHAWKWTCRALSAPRSFARERIVGSTRFYAAKITLQTSQWRGGGFY